MVLGNLIFQAEVVEQRFRAVVLPHHDLQGALRKAKKRELDDRYTDPNFNNARNCDSFIGPISCQALRVPTP
jgi:hypothetical protein